MLIAFRAILNTIDSRSKIGGIKPSFFMSKFLIFLIGSLVLSEVAFAGIPQNKNSTKWVKISKTFKINTEDVEVKKGKLRFYVERTAYKEEIVNRFGRYSWEGKLKLIVINSPQLFRHLIVSDGTPLLMVGKKSNLIRLAMI